MKKKKTIEKKENFHDRSYVGTNHVHLQNIYFCVDELYISNINEFKRGFQLSHKLNFYKLLIFEHLTYAYVYTCVNVYVAPTHTYIANIYTLTGNVVAILFSLFFSILKEVTIKWWKSKCN